MRNKLVIGAVQPVVGTYLLEARNFPTNIFAQIHRTVGRLFSASQLYLW